MRIARYTAGITLAALVGLFAAGCSRDTPQSLIAKGRADLEAKDARSALIQLKAALQADPQSVEARYLLGRAMLASGDAAGAVIELTKAMEQRYDAELVLPELASALLVAGQSRKLATTWAQTDLQDKAAQASLKASVATAWAALGDDAKARGAIDAALAAVPGHPRALILKARLAAGKDDVTSSLKTIEDLLARDPGLAEAWHLKGELLWAARHDRAAAEQALRKALSIDKTFVHSHAALIQMRLQANDVAAAKAQAEEMRAAIPNHPHILLVDGQLALLEKDYKTAREKTDLLLRGAPDNPAVLMLAGLLETRAGSPVVAQNHFAKLVQIDPKHSAARRELARLHLRLGQPVKALEVLQPLVVPGSPDADAQAIAGSAFIQLGDPAAAEARFVEAHRLRPDNQRLRAAAALSRIGRGDADAGFAQLEQISGGTDDKFASLALITSRMRVGDLDKALVAVDALLLKAPADASAHELRGRVLVARKDLVAARQAYEKALSLDPALFAATLGLATLDLAEKKPDQARSRLQAAISGEPGNIGARLSLAELNERSGAPLDETRQIFVDAIKAAPTESAPRLAFIEFLFRMRQLNQALEQAQQATAAIPNDLDLLDALARAQAQKGDLQQAVSTFRRIIGIEPNRARPHLRIGDILKSQGNLGAAIASMRRALEIEPDFEPARQALIDALVADRRPKEAIEVARELQRRAPESRRGYVLEGAIQHRAKNYDAAVAAFRQGVKQLPEDRQLASLLVQSLLEAGRIQEAESFGREWMKRQPDDAGMQYFMATSAMRRGDLETAESLLRRTLEMAPKQALALNNLAWVMLQRGRPGALEPAKKAAEMLPREPAVMDTLAQALAAEKDFSSAMNLQKQAVELAPGNMELRLTLARIALQSGDKALARAELERLAALGTRFKQHADVTRMLKSL